MTLVLDHADSGLGGTSPDRAQAAKRRTLSIGLVNNMPDAALRATERQFIRLVRAAAGTAPIRFHRYHLRSIARGPEAAAYLRAHSSETTRLGRVPLDALMVTGCEPKAATLAEEPFWADFVRVVDWVRDNGIASYWSCLAAHAAVLALDGIERHRLSAKRCGMLACEARAAHPLLDGVPARLVMPHSRWNDLRGSDLAVGGYTVLTGSSEAGVNLFVKDGPGTALFCQAHPEYEPDSLAREYRRDVARYLRGETNSFPGPPAACFDDTTLTALDTFRTLAQVDRTALRLGDLPVFAARQGLDEAWQVALLPVFRNWLAAMDTAAAAPEPPHRAALADTPNLPH